MPELPLELYQAIADEVNSQLDLFTLLRVSINFNAAAERSLYYTIALSGNQPPLDIARKKLSVFERISTCPRVAAYVFHLTINLFSWPLLSSYTPSSFANLFLSVPNLKSLCIFPSHQIIHGLPARAPFLLRTFSYSGQEYSWDPSFTPIVEAFLEAQVELEELLSTGVGFEVITLTPSALPKLTTVYGHGKFVRRLLPGRPVTRVTVWYEDDTSSIIAGPIRSLCVNSTTHLESYTSLSPSVVFLQCSASRYEDEGLTQHLGCFSRLQKLVVVIYTGPHWADEYRGWTNEEQLAFVKLVFSSCPSICYIELYDISGTRESRQSMMWTRGSQTGAPSIYDWDEWRTI